MFNVKLKVDTLYLQITRLDHMIVCMHAHVTLNSHYHHLSVQGVYNIQFVH